METSPCKGINNVRRAAAAAAAATFRCRFLFPRLVSRSVADDAIAGRQLQNKKNKKIPNKGKLFKTQSRCRDPTKLSKFGGERKLFLGHYQIRGDRRLLFHLTYDRHLWARPRSTTPPTAGANELQSTVRHWTSKNISPRRQPDVATSVDV